MFNNFSKFPGKFCRNFCQKLSMSKKFWEVVQKKISDFSQKFLERLKINFQKKESTFAKKGENFLGNPYRAKFRNFHDGVRNDFSGSFVFSSVTLVTRVYRVNSLRKNIHHFLYTLDKMLINCGDAVIFLGTNIFVKV